MECTIHSTEGEVFRLRPYDEDDVDLLFDAATESVEHLSRFQ